MALRMAEKRNAFAPLFKQMPCRNEAPMKVIRIDAGKIRCPQIHQRDRQCQFTQLDQSFRFQIPCGNQRVRLMQINEFSQRIFRANRQETHRNIVFPAGVSHPKHHAGIERQCTGYIVLAVQQK
ncbi:hypothetical protein D3C73_1289100 [compost metagenome]